MQTYLVYKPNELKAQRVTKKLRDEHAFAEAQLLLDQYKTNRIFIRTEGSNLLWLMHKVGKQYHMAGTIIGRKKKTSTKINVTYIES